MKKAVVCMSRHGESNTGMTKLIALATVPCSKYGRMKANIV